MTELHIDLNAAASVTSSVAERANNPAPVRPLTGRPDPPAARPSAVCKSPIKKAAVNQVPDYQERYQSNLAGTSIAPGRVFSGRVTAAGKPSAGNINVKNKQFVRYHHGPVHASAKEPFGFTPAERHKIDRMGRKMCETGSTSFASVMASDSREAPLLPRRGKQPTKMQLPNGPLAYCG
jgi:hypothetical protein